MRPPARTAAYRLIEREIGLCLQGHAIQTLYFDSDGKPNTAERIEWQLMDGTSFAVQVFGREDKQVIFILQPNGEFIHFTDPKEAMAANLGPCEASAAIIRARQEF